MRLKTLLFAICSLILQQQPAALADAADSDLLLPAKEMFNSGDYESAEELLKMSLNKESPGGVRYAVTLQNLALIEYMNFHFLEAEKLYMQAIGITESIFGKDSLPVANNLYGLSRCLRRSNQLVEAEQCLSRLLDVRSKQLGAEHRLVSNTLFDLAVNYDRQEKYEQAGPFYARALELREKESGRNSSALRQLLESYAQCLHRLHNENKASEIEQRIRELEPGISASTARIQEDGSGWQSTIYALP